MIFTPFDTLSRARILMMADQTGTPGVTLLNVEELHGGNSSNMMRGNDDGLIMRGFNGNDKVYGGAGDDSLDGGAGADVAVFSGNRADYTITENPDGSLTVTHNGGGAHGVDTLTNVETLQFADETVVPFGPTASTARTTVEMNGSVDWKMSVSDATDAPADMTYTLVEPWPEHGMVHFENGTYNYVPDYGYTGHDSINYLATDTDGNTVQGSILVIVSPTVGESFVNVETDGNQGDPVIADLNDGRYVIAWHSNGNDTADNSDFEITLDLTSGGTIVVTDLDNAINDLADLTTHVTLNGA